MGKCIVCNREIPINETHLITIFGDCCLAHEGTEELEKILNDKAKESIDCLNRHFE